MPHAPAKSRTTRLTKEAYAAGVKHAVATFAAPAVAKAKVPAVPGPPKLPAAPKAPEPLTHQTNDTNSSMASANTRLAGPETMPAAR